VTWAEAWNGTSWSTQATPDPSGATSSDLLGVACTSASACVAVGWYRSSAGLPSTLAEVWNGTSWSIQTTPNPAGATGSGLFAVSCTSTSGCAAVGSYTNSAGVELSLAEAWNGKSWSIQPTPQPAGSIGSDLLGVSCTSATACTAVGAYGSSAGTTLRLAEDWNGKSWSIQTTPQPAGATASEFRGVSCTPGIVCVAVGIYESSGGATLALAEAWNGKSWSVQASANPAGSLSSGFLGVSCASASTCTAVGSYDNSAREGLTLAEAWNGKTWSVQATPNPAGFTGSGFLAVSCAPASVCVATGSYTHGADSIDMPLVEARNGTSWSIQASANPVGAAISDLLGVSCTSASSCTAAGIYENSVGTTLTLAEGWNGERWNIETTPNPVGAGSGEFTAVSCVSASVCVAVGWYIKGAGTTDLTLAEAWNGTTWNIETTPNQAGASESNLFGVSCTSASACVAVGDYVNGVGADRTLAEAWNGKSWNIQTTSNPGAAVSRFFGVSCTSASACTAVGTYSLTGNGSLTLAERWNGASWSVQTTPDNVKSASSVLSGVSCTSASACTAFGTTDEGGPGGPTLAEAWNGKSWSIQTTPNPTGSVGSTSTGVSCISASACAAVGYYTSRSGLPVTFAEAWDGKTWIIQSTPNPAGTLISILNGVSCTSADCTAVGYHQGSSGLPVTLVVTSSGV